MEINELYKMNETCYTMISHCETKMSILTAIDLGIITAIIGVYSSNDFFSCYACNNTVPFWIVTGYFILVSLGSFVSLIISLVSTKANFSKDIKNVNIAYYGSLKDISKEEYIGLLNEKEIISSLAEENIELSKIVYKKYKRFNLALAFFLYSIMLGVPLIFSFFKRKNR